MIIREDEETTYGKFCLVVGALESYWNPKTRKRGNDFLPFRIADKRFFPTREHATAFQKRWRSAIRLPKGDSARVLSIPQLKKKEGGTTLLHKTLTNLALDDMARYLADQAVRADEQYSDEALTALITAVDKVCRTEDVTLSEVISIDLSQIEATVENDEGISASTHTSTWSTSVTGVWTTNEGRTFELRGISIGDTTRI